MGAPIIAVMAPTGSWAGDIIVLAIVSAVTRYAPPIKKDAGITILLSTPKMNLQTWGTSKPTNPIIPLTDTTEPINRLVNK